MLSEFEERVAELLDRKLEAAGLDPASNKLTDEDIAKIEELTKEAQDEAR
jgi:hypothetical protein